MSFCILQLLTTAEILKPMTIKNRTKCQVNVEFSIFYEGLNCFYRNLILKTTTKFAMINH